MRSVRITPVESVHRAPFSRDPSVWKCTANAPVRTSTARTHPSDVP